MTIRTVLFALLIGSAGSVCAQAGDPPTLTICMQQNDPPLSLRAGDSPTGFDLALARAISERLGRSLRIQWFVSRDDPDSNLAKDSNALLSDGRCQLVAEYPLTDGMLERPRFPSVRLPPFAGAKPDDRRRWVPAGQLAATQPYRWDSLGVIMAAARDGTAIRTLADLKGMKLGVQIATLSDAIAMRYDDGALSQDVVHLPDSADVFASLKRGELDAALVDMRAFDAWRLRHGPDGLTATGYRHSIGFNMGFAGLASDPALIGQVDNALADLEAQNALAPMAVAAGLTFVPPRAPAVSPDVLPKALNGD